MQNVSFSSLIHTNDLANYAQSNLDRHIGILTDFIERALAKKSKFEVFAFLLLSSHIFPQQQQTYPVDYAKNVTSESRLHDLSDGYIFVTYSFNPQNQNPKQESWVYPVYLGVIALSFKWEGRILGKSGQYACNTMSPWTSTSTSTPDFSKTNTEDTSSDVISNQPKEVKEKAPLNHRNSKFPSKPFSPSSTTNPLTFPPIHLTFPQVTVHIVDNQSRCHKSTNPRLNKRPTMSSTVSHQNLSDVPEDFKGTPPLGEEILADLCKSQLLLMQMMANQSQ